MADRVTLPNTQPAESLDWDDPNNLDIVDVWATIQGEGPLAGLPATFVRFAGCNLCCGLCDTDYTTGRNKTPVDLLLGRIESEKNPKLDRPLVVLTGGEPFRQNLCFLVATLLKRRYTVQVETNGTIMPAGDAELWDKCVIVCSPKAPAVHPRLIRHVDSYKYVIQAGRVSREDGLPTSILGDDSKRPARPWAGVGQWNPGHVTVQPCDEQDEICHQANLQEAVKSSMKFGYRLQVQIHKIAKLK